MDISVVIPAYNEVDRLPPTLREVTTYLAANFASWEVIVSDDGSTDGTVERLAPSFPDIKFLRDPVNAGKGAAVRRGMLAAQGDLVLFSDADLSTPIDELGPMVRVMKERGTDIVIASRGLSDSKLEVRQPWWRELAGRIFNLLVRPLSGLPFRDTQCGFKLFRYRAAQDVFRSIRCNDWAFDVEALMVASMLGYRVIEVPVRWINEERSKVRILVDAPKMAFDVLRFRWWQFSGSYEK